MNNIINSNIDFTPLIKRFLKIVEQYPNNESIVFYDPEKKAKTYKQLRDKVYAISSLISENNPKNKMVLIYIDDPFLLSASIMAAIMLAVPFYLHSKDNPVNRMAGIIGESGCILVDHETTLFHGINENICNVNECCENIFKIQAYHADQNTPLYIVFTSGSTGQPKGILINQGGLHNYIDWRITRYGIKDNDVILQLLSVSFDGFYSNFFTALLSGSTLVYSNVKEVDNLKKVFKSESVTNISLTPSMFYFLTKILDKDSFKSLHTVVFGGEKINDTIAETLIKYNQVRYINEYGVAENCIATTAKIDYTASDLNNIGESISNCVTVIMDNNSNELPINKIGEICVGGPGLANSYYFYENGVEDKFIDTNKGRLYKTGDLGKKLLNGEIQFISRNDRQIMVLGCRIELGEIENVVENIYGVVNAYAFFHSNDMINKLELFIIVDDYFKDINEVRNRITEYLPAYMIPQKITQIPYCSFKPNQKVTYDLLSSFQEDNKKNIIHSNDPIIIFLMKAWQEIFLIKDWSLDDNFFNEGGNSFNIIILQETIYKEFKVKIPLFDLYKNPTLEMQKKIIKEYLENKDD